jgi:hypothetical protein
MFLFKGAEAQSQLRRQGESELDYYERRYQERVNTFIMFSFILFYSFLSSKNFPVVFVHHRIRTILMLN